MNEAIPFIAVVAVFFAIGLVFKIAALRESRRSGQPDRLDE